MSKKEITNMRDLLEYEVRDLYSAEKQLIDALPKMIEKSSHSDLKDSLRSHLEETKKQKERLERVMEKLDMERSSDKCEAMEGLIEEAEELFDLDIDSDVLDAAIIAAAQRVEHYEISAYGSARTFARTLGLTDVESLLEETLREEKEADSKLTKVATTNVNRDATGSAR